MPAPVQLPLALAHTPHLDREAFIRGPSNDAALALLERWPDWPAPLAVLSGPPGSGKTHLAHIWAARAGAEIVEAAALSGEGVPSLAPGALVIEDVAPGAAPEAALFHLINRAKEEGGSLLLTARLPAEQWGVTLPDVRSRLRMATPAALGAPDDELLRAVLVKLFCDRQLVVEKPVIDYLLVRMERSLSAAVALVEAADREALALGRAITKQVAAAALAALPREAGEFPEPQ